MKKFILFLCVFIILSCSGNQNHGYGYNTKTEIPASSLPIEQVDSSSTSVKQTKRKWRDKLNDHIMPMYDLSGEYISSVYAYKGKFDGVEFYIFKDGDCLAVIPVSMCK